MPVPSPHHAWLDRLHAKYHHPRYISPDPLEKVRAFGRPEDREVVGLVAALLAYGNVKAILRGIDEVTGRLGPSPAAYLAGASDRRIADDFRGFRYRVTGEDEMAALLRAVRDLRSAHGSLGRSFEHCVGRDDPTLVTAMSTWTGQLAAAADQPLHHLLPSPARGSACKRLCLYLRWMVRADRIDPGGWNPRLAGRLLAPVDTHLHGIARRLGWTQRRQSTLRTALDITFALKQVCPRDPLCYDFALTRPGIRREPMPELVTATGPPRTGSVANPWPATEQHRG